MSATFLILRDAAQEAAPQGWGRSCSTLCRWFRIGGRLRVKSGFTARLRGDGRDPAWL